MTKTTKTTTVAATTGSSILSVFNDIVNEVNIAKAQIVYKDFVRKDTERLQLIASLKNSIKSLSNEVESLESKAAKAEKVSNVAALTFKVAKTKADISVVEARIEELETLRSAANARRDAFTEAFDADPYSAVIDSDLVREEIALKVAAVKVA